VNLFIKQASNLTQSTDFLGTQHEGNTSKIGFETPFTYTRMTTVRIFQAGSNLAQPKRVPGKLHFV